MEIFSPNAFFISSNVTSVSSTTSWSNALAIAVGPNPISLLTILATDIG